MNQVGNSIKAARNIIIFCHIRPDGDAIGSMLALGEGLKKYGKDVIMVSSDGIPEKFQGLPGAETVEKETSQKAELSIAVDCSTRDMLGSSFEAFKKSNRTVEIDHHETRKPFADMGLVDTEASAVGEIIYLLLNELKIKIDKNIAENILTSVIVETNSFNLPSIRPFTFSMCAELLKTGVDYYSLTNSVYWSRNRVSTVITGLCLSKCRFTDKGRIAWTTVWREELEKYNAKEENIETVTGDMQAVSGVKAALFFIEKNKETIRVSMRSNGSINIGAIAREYGGGGHFNSAGCIIKNKKSHIKGLIERVESEIL